MKQSKIAMLIFLLGITVISCDDSATEPVDENGSIYIESTPTGAEIWLDAVNTNEVTPATITASAGTHIVTLKKDGYGDKDFTVSVTGGQQFSLTSGTTLEQLGSLNISSEPAGATIWLEGVNTGEVTPHNFALVDDNYTITLQYENYSDSTFITQIANAGSMTLLINLRPEFLTTLNATIWETEGTSTDQPSGLDLSTGSASSILAGSNEEVDLFYESEGRIVMSATGRNGMTRETFFKVGNGSNLLDGINSSQKDGTWTTSVADDESNYIFVYDTDGHYSKFIILGIDGGTSEDPARVRVRWLYNTNQNNVEF